MKKYISIFVFGLMLLFGAKNASASFIFSPVSPQLAGTSVNVDYSSAGSADTINVFDPSGAHCAQYSPFPADTGDITSSCGGSGVYVFTLCNSNVSASSCVNSDLTAEEADLGYVSQSSYTFDTAPIHGIGFLGGTAPSVGTPFDGSALQSQTATALGSTMDGIGPVLAVVIGIGLAVVIARNIANLYTQAPTEEVKKKR